MRSGSRISSEAYGRTRSRYRPPSSRPTGCPATLPRMSQRRHIDAADGVCDSIRRDPARKCSDATSRLPAPARAHFRPIEGSQDLKDSADQCFAGEHAAPPCTPSGEHGDQCVNTIGRLDFIGPAPLGSATAQPESADLTDLQLTSHSSQRTSRLGRGNPSDKMF